MPPTTSCGRVSLLTNVTRCPTAIVISSGVMPAAVIVTVGGPPARRRRGDGVVTGGVGAVGVDGDVAVPPEQAAAMVSEARRIVKRSTASTFDAGGAAGIDAVNLSRHLGFARSGGFPQSAYFVTPGAAW